jgi:hypothetical protein
MYDMAKYLFKIEHAALENLYPATSVLTCSFVLNGPGLKDHSLPKRENFWDGKILAKVTPIG